MGGDVDPGPGRFERLAVAAERLAREIFEDAGGAHDLAGPFRQRLAFLAGEQAAEILRPLHDDRADLVEQVRAHLGRGLGPGREGLARGLGRRVTSAAVPRG